MFITFLIILIILIAVVGLYRTTYNLDDDYEDEENWTQEYYDFLKEEEKKDE